MTQATIYADLLAHCAAPITISACRKWCGALDRSELQTGCPYEITLAAYIEGGLKKEAELHQQFSEYRVRENGEWFKHSGALKSFITSISKEIA